jgi:VanZ like protein
VWRRWGVLGAYVALVYASLPIGPRVGLAVARTRPGEWLFGPGLPLLAVAGIVVLMAVIARRSAPWWAYVALAVAGAGYALAFSWLRAQHLERTHLAEYGVVAWLAWRALAPLVPGPLAGYAAAAALGGLIGYGDELLQAVTPGRVYDLRDVGMNVVGVLLGMLVLAAARAGREDGTQRRIESTKITASSRIITAMKKPE